MIRSRSGFLMVDMNVIDLGDRDRMARMARMELYSG